MAMEKILWDHGCKGGEGSERAGLWFEWNQPQNDKLRGSAMTWEEWGTWEVLAELVLCIFKQVLLAAPCRGKCGEHWGRQEADGTIQIED